MHGHIQHKKYGAGMRIGAYKNRVNIIINIFEVLNKFGFCSKIIRCLDGWLK